MANKEQLDILKQGVKVWNQWRQESPEIQPDLTGAFLNHAHLNGVFFFGADLMGVHLSKADLGRAEFGRANLSKANLSKANLAGANLAGANLSEANLGGAFLTEANLRAANLHYADLHTADLRHADLFEANFSGANLFGADLSSAELGRTDLSRANLSQVNLSFAALVETNLMETTLTNSHIYGISAWSVNLTGAIQNNLVITRKGELTITVDNLEVAQFIYLLLNSPKIREVIDTIAKKAVLILGRFSPKRKAVLDALKDALRQQEYLPILFDFEKPASRDITETVSTLAHLARFVIADITDAKSIPQELMTIVPNLPSVPVQPLILTSQHDSGMFEHFTRFPWVLPVYRYRDEINLLQSLQEKVIIPAEQKAKELAKR